MDALIGLLILFGIFSRLNKKKKQQEAARKAQRLAAAFAEAATVKPEKPAAKPAPAKKPPAAKKKDVQQKIPFTKEEWMEFLAAENIKAPAAKPAAEGDGRSPSTSNEGKPSLRQRIPEGASPELRSTQGESEEEHRRHVERIAHEEQKLQAETDALQELRRVNRRKLREAVVMSEILSRPVALRSRGHR